MDPSRCPTSKYLAATSALGGPSFPLPGSFGHRLGRRGAPLRQRGAEAVGALVGSGTGALVVLDLLHREGLNQSSTVMSQLIRGQRMLQPGKFSDTCTYF